MRKNKKRKTLLILLTLVLGVSIGYAAIATTLKINGTSKVKKATWDVHWENVQVTEGSVEGSDAVTNAAHILDDDRTTVEYAVILSEPGDFYEFTVDAVNNGTIDAMIGVKVNENTEIPDYVRYSVTYLDGSEIENKHLLAKKTGNEPTKETYKVRVEYREDIDPSQLPTDDGQELSFDFSVEYVQADDTATESHPKKLCRRAQELHTEECIQTDNTYYCSGNKHSTGDIVTFGNTVTTKGKLTAGDAFDCDVDGNGVYDSETERFYYVSDYYDTTGRFFNSSYATLIYYSSVKEGKPDSGTKAKYYDDDSKPSWDSTKNENFHGPTIAYQQLPSTTQWSNVKLLNITRLLLNEKGEATTHEGAYPLTRFSYTDKAARFLTVQEVNNACNIEAGNSVLGELNNCEFLFENTGYTSHYVSAWGYWLESVEAYSEKRAMYINDTYRDVGSNEVTETNFAVRPAIDVAKADMSF